MTIQGSILGLRENISTWCIYSLLMGLLTFAAFGNLSTHLFSTHDQEFLRDAAASQGPFSFIVSPERSYPHLYLWAAYKLFRQDPAGYHHLQVWLHFLASLLVALTFRRLGATFELSLVGGLLFLMNVAHFDAVHWISATHYIFALIFGLVAVLLYFRCLETSHYRWSFAAASALAVAMFAHASTGAVTLFFLILSLQKKLPRLKAIYMLLPQFAVAGLCGVVLNLVFAKEHQMSTVPIVSQPVDVIRNLFWFSGRLVTTAHWFPEFLALAEHTNWELAIGFIFLALSIFLSIRNRGSLLLWTVWLISLTLPFMKLGAMPHITGPSRYVYLSSLGSSFILAWTVHTFVGWVGKRQHDLARPLLLGCVGILLVFSLLGLQRTEAISLHLSSGIYIYKKNQPEIGLQLSRRAIARNPRVLPADAYFRLATGSFATGKSIERILRKALEEDPASPDLNMLLGVSAFLSKDPQVRHAGEKRVEEALNASRDSKSLRLNTAVAFNNLAAFYLNAKDYHRGIEIYKKALSYDPTSPKALFNLGNAFYHIGEPQKAIEILKNLLKAQPPDGIAWMSARNLSTILVEQGLDEEAIPFYTRAIDANPQDSLSHHSLAIALKQTGRFEEAVQAYKTYLMFQPDNWQARLSLAQAYENLGRIEEAIAEYRDALTLGPDNGEARANLETLLEFKNAK